MVHIEFTTDNSAFHNDNGEYDVYWRNAETIRILKGIINKLELGYESGTIADINGNAIGEWNID